jgi:hypothetical protein
VDNFQEIGAEEVDSIISRFLKGEIDEHELDLILQLRAGEGFTDIAAIMAFIIFINWLDSLQVVESFQANPLSHMDPIGWRNGDYNYPKPNRGVAVV